MATDPIRRDHPSRRPGRHRHRLLVAALTAAAIVPVVSGTSPIEAAAPTDLFFSEYVESTFANDRALEIFNGTGAPIDLSVYGIQIWVDGDASAPVQVFGLSGSLAPGDVYVVTDWMPSATAGMGDLLVDLSAMTGNDAVVLTKGAGMIDVIGQIGVDPGPGGWGTLDTTTVDHTLRRKPYVVAGHTDAYGPFDPSVEWDGFPVDTFAGLGFHSLDAAGTVDATVTVSASVACLLVSTPGVDFGTLPLGAEHQPGTPDITVTSCSEIPESVLALATDATSSSGVTWTLTDAVATCADQLPSNHYRLALESADLAGTVGLGTDGALLQSLSPGASTTHTPYIWTACPSSVGGGQTMSMQIVYVATV